MPMRRRPRHRIKDGTSTRSKKDGKKIIVQPATPESVDAHLGFMKTKGRLLKALLEEKKREREL